MKKLVTVLTIILLAAASARSVERPAVPTDTPFAYDSNQCPVEVMDWAVVEPNMSIIYQGTVTNRGLQVDVEAVNLTEPNDHIIVDFFGMEKAPGGYFKRHFQFNFTPQPVERVNYIRITATDRAGRTDSRMLVVYAVFDEPPVLMPYEKEPVSIEQLNAASRFVQVAKKRGIHMGYSVVWD